MQTGAVCAARRKRGTCASSPADRNGTEIDQGFDELDRPRARELALATGVGGDTDESFAYGASGRVVEAPGNDSIVQFTHDSLFRAHTEVQGADP